MSRPNRIELLSKFFPEIREKSTPGEKEASLRLNTLACEAILADLIQKYDNAFQQKGKGTLCLLLPEDGEAVYMSADDWQRDLETAKASGHRDIEDFCSSVIAKVDEINPDKAALVMLVDNTSAQLFPVDREYPAQSIQAMLEEFAE